MSLKSKFDAVYKRKVEDNLDKTVRATALAVMSNIVIATPVDTGRARNNWNADINAVDASTTKEANPNANGIGKVTDALARYKKGATVFISNNLPYIRRLNEGHSKQAPANFVDKAVMIGKRQGKEIAKRDFNK